MKRRLLIVALILVGAGVITILYYSARGSRAVDQSSLEKEDIRSIISRYDIKHKEEMDKMIISLEGYASGIPDEMRRMEVWYRVAEVLGMSIDEVRKMREDVKRRLEDKKPMVPEPPRLLGEYFREGLDVLRKALNERSLQKLEGVPEGVKAVDIPDGIEFLKEVLEKGNITLKIYAAGALLRLGDTSGINILKYAISDRVSNWQLKLYAGEALAEKGYSEGVSVIERYLDDSNTWHIKERAARAGGCVKTEEMKKRLTILMADSSPYVCLGAAEGLARMGNQDGINYLRNALLSESSSIQQSAAEALARLNDTSAMGYFRMQMTSDDKFVKLQAAKNLAFMGDYGGMDFLESMLKDEDEALRFYAASALVEISSKKGRT